MMLKRVICIMYVNLLFFFSLLLDIVLIVEQSIMPFIVSFFLITANVGIYIDKCVLRMSVNNSSDCIACSVLFFTVNIRSMSKSC